MPKMRTFSIYGGEVIALLVFVAGVHAWWWQGDRSEGQYLVMLGMLCFSSCQNDRLKQRVKALEDRFIPSYSKEDNQDQTRRE